MHVNASVKFTSQYGRRQIFCAIRLLTIWPMLFDWQEDSNEHNDVGSDPAYGEVLARMHEALFEWARKPRQRSPMASLNLPISQAV
jgi:hypothetical protein